MRRILALLLIALYFASPILALQGLTAAAKAGDKARLESAVDFPAVGAAKTSSGTPVSPVTTGGRSCATCFIVPSSL